MKTWILIMNLALFATLCDAQTIQWVDINGYAAPTQVVETSTGHLFMLSNTKLYSSSDEGGTWSLVDNLPEGWIQRIFSRNGRLVVYTNIHLVGYGILTSTDDGVSWTEEYKNWEAANGLFLSDSGSIYKASFFYQNAELDRLNNGSWQYISSPPISVPSIVTGSLLSTIDHRNTIFIANQGGPGGLYASSDGGKSWVLRLGARSVSVMSVLPDSNMLVGLSPIKSASGVLLTKDGGKTWSDLGLSDEQINALTDDSSIDPLAATGDGLFRYDADNELWNAFGPRSDELNLVVRTGAGVIVAANRASLYRSTDHGTTWYVNGPRSEDVSALASSSAFNTLLAGTLGNRLLLSSDNGINWRQTPPGTTGDYVFSLATTPTAFLAGTDRGLYCSSDQGLSWVSLTKRTVAGSIFAVQVRPSGALLIGTNYGVYRSNDDGEHWQQAGLAAHQVRHLAGSSGAVAYAHDEMNQLYVSSDDGASWQAKSTIPEDIQSLTVNDADGTVGIGGYGGIYQSTDQGASWQYQHFTSTYVYALGYSGPGAIFAGTGEGVFRSIDSGAIWQKSKDLPAATILTINSDQGHNFYLGLYHGGVMMSSQPVTSVLSVKDDRSVPRETKLFQNYPNPFNPTTELQFTVATAQQISLTVYDLLGRELVRLVNEVKQPGSYKVSWNAANYPSGLYFYRLNGDRYNEVRKMMLLK